MRNSDSTSWSTVTNMVGCVLYISKCTVSGFNEFWSQGRKSTNFCELGSFGPHSALFQIVMARCMGRFAQHGLDFRTMPSMAHIRVILYPLSGKCSVMCQLILGFRGKVIKRFRMLRSCQLSIWWCSWYGMIQYTWLLLSNHYLEPKWVTDFDNRPFERYICPLVSSFGFYMVETIIGVSSLVANVWTIIPFLHLFSFLNINKQLFHGWHADLKYVQH